MIEQSVWLSVDEVLTSMLIPKNMAAAKMWWMHHASGVRRLGWSSEPCADSESGWWVGGLVVLAVLVLET